LLATSPATIGAHPIYGSLAVLAQVICRTERM
jgi:hypothetical protein